MENKKYFIQLNLEICSNHQKQQLMNFIENYSGDYEVPLFAEMEVQK